MIQALLAHSTRILRRVAIRHRLIASLILLSLLPLLVSGYIAFVESSQAIENKARLFATEIVTQVARNVQLRIANIETNAATLVLSQRVQSEFTRYTDDTPTEQAEARAMMPTILLDTFGAFEHVKQMFFLDRAHQIMDSQVFSTLGRSVEQFCAQAPRQSNQPYWGTIDLWGGEKGIVMLQDVYFKANNQWAGSLFLGIKRAYFSEIFDDVNLGPGSDIYILDARDGNIIVASKTRLTLVTPANRTANPQLVQEVQRALQNSQQSGFMTYVNTDPVSASRTLDTSDREVVTVFARIANTSWFVVNTIPHANLQAEARAVREKIFLIGVLGIVFAALVSFILWRSISDPLRRLLARIQQTESGNFPIPLTYEGHDELTTLSKTFSAMSLKISEEHARLEQRVLARTQDLQEANLKLEQLSTTDALTAIANRRRFDAVLADEWHRAARLGQPLALAMIDIDWFKKYNDHYGHPAGDECLRRVAAVIAHSVQRPGDLVARYGGEEFAFIAPGMDCNSAQQIAVQLCKELQALALPHALSNFGCVTISIGVAAMVPSNEEGADALVLAADQAMYRAKEQGRNRASL